MIARLSRLLRRRATGAVLGQVTQAIAGLVLQAAAARYLGAAGLTTFALGYGLIVLATAVCSGLVGDSLTVLDRRDPGIRAGLLAWSALVPAVAGVLFTAAAAVTGLMAAWPSILVGAATGAFVIEDTLRRLLMANGRFWSLPVVDGVSLVLALVSLALAGAVGELSLTSFVVALLVGQTGAALAAWLRLPVAERPRGPWRGGNVRAVFGFGVWRAGAQAVRPTLLTVLRTLVVVAAGAAAYGPLEAARVFTAPTLVLVGGLGSFLLPHFVGLQSRSAAHSLRAADRAACLLAVSVGAIGLAACALVPFAGPLLSGGAYRIPVVAVAGWSAYAVASGVLLPYSSLATVHRRQRRVLALRGLELCSLGLVALLLLVDGGALWAPMALCLGPLLAAVAVRSLVLRPLTRPSPLAPAQVDPAGV